MTDFVSLLPFYLSTVAEATSECHCCVSQSTSNKQRQLYLSFHGFPSDLIEKKKWVVAIHQDEGLNFRIQSGSMFVCSQHLWEASVVLRRESRGPISSSQLNLKKRPDDTFDVRTLRN
uniref:THAP-type domain-containing protein n=1 Tax=Sphaeramia orbicularis TaxID=375764 RepID=A0A673C587_9TELE